MEAQREKLHKVKSFPVFEVKRIWKNISSEKG